MDNFIRPSDTKSFKQCARKFWFDHQDNGIETEEDEFQKHLSKKGAEHERKVIESLGEMIRATSPEHTQKLMAEGVSIYQPQFVDEERGILCTPDFLLKTPEGEYEVGVATLSSSLKKKPDIKLQLGMSRTLSRTTLPAKAFLRSEVVETVGEEYDDKVIEIISEMRNTLNSEIPPERYFTYSDCSICSYNTRCKPEFEEKGDLTLVFDLSKYVANTLRSQGITTIHQLAETNPQDIDDGPSLKNPEKKQTLVLQAKSQLSGKIFKKAPLELPTGTWIHFDVESHSISDTAPTVVYLWGFLPPPYEQHSMEYVWSDDSPDNDRKAWNEVLRLIERYKEEFPDLKLIHFSRYEANQIESYALRYDMMEHPIVKWLLGDDTPLLDLQAVVKNSLVLPVQSYGLKEICKDERLVNFQWELEESGSQWSVGRYMDYLESASSITRKAIKKEIVTYNRDDVLATRKLEEWLRKAPWGSEGE